MKTVNIELAKTALEKVDGISFEKFANAMFSELIGADYIPLGGTKDWGADGTLNSVAQSNRSTTFYQMSIQDNFRNKIRETVARLREVGRDVKELCYATSITVPRLDIEENELGEELDVIVRIRDGEYLAPRINSSPATLAAYSTYLAPFVTYLSDFSQSSLLGESLHAPNPSVYVFLRNELESRESGGASEGLVDGLIVWALRDTNSDAKKFMTPAEVSAQIEKEAPGIIEVIGDAIPKRLKHLSRIPKNQQRPIRHHSSGNKFCIAFDLHKQMRDENLSAEVLRREVIVAYKARILAADPNADHPFVDRAAGMSLKALERCIEQEGLEFAAFLRGDSEEDVPIVKSIESTIYDDAVAMKNVKRYREAIEGVLKVALTNPDENERKLYSRIASVYTILFCLRTEPKVINYFERMASHFSFIVGSDILINALSERFLPETKRVFRNTLRLIKASGGTLILTEPVVDEIQTHINASNQEFKYHYQDAEDAISEEEVDLIDRPLIRAYFQKNLYPVKNAPKNWQQFLRNYCDPQAIKSTHSKEEIRKYLMTEIGMTYEPRKEIEDKCAKRDVKALASLMMPYKKDIALAKNDALLTHLVYVKRAEGKERDDVSGYGLKTWWLTNESQIVNIAKPIIQDEGASFLMRPEYLLNFLTLLPKKPDARKIFDTLFPSLLGAHLARNHAPAHVQRLHEYLKEIKSVDPSRRTVMIAEKADALKADLRSPSWFRWSPGFDNEGA